MRISDWSSDVCSSDLDPDTGRRVSRLNPQSEWIVQEVPELRVVDDALWDCAKQRQTELAKRYGASIKSVRAHHANRLRGMHRKRHLLSGLLTCGACGGSYAILVKDRYGCSTHYRRRACTHGHTIRREPGRPSWRARVCQAGWHSGVAAHKQKNK